jgi:hypothetical protein
MKRKGQQLVAQKKKRKEKEKRKERIQCRTVHLFLLFIQPLSSFLLLSQLKRKRRRRKKTRHLSVVMYIHVYKKKQPQMSPVER